MLIRWSPRAQRDFEAIVSFIRRDNAEAARRVAAVVLERIAALERFPLLGRAGRGGTRELVCSPWRYVLVYRIRDSVVEIVRFMHGSRLRPPS